VREAAINDEVFAVILADDLIDGKPPVLQQMTELFERHQSPMVAVQQVKREHTAQYGIVKTEPVTENLERIMAIVEKPQAEAAPSTLGWSGAISSRRASFTISPMRTGAGSEIQLTDAIAQLLAEDACSRTASWGPYDCARSSGT